MKISLQVILILSLVVLNIKSKKIEIFDVLQIKSLVNIHFDLSEALDSSLKTNLNKKKKLLSRLKDVDLRLVNYAKISSANMMNLKKILSQVDQERKIIKEKSPITKEKSASDYINSITGFWG